MLLSLVLCTACSLTSAGVAPLPKTPPKELTAPEPAPKTSEVQEKGPKKIGRKAGDTVRKTGQAIGKAGKQVGETVKVGVQKVGQVVKEGGEKLEQAASSVGKGIKDGLGGK